jgi:hypothetical protein
MRLFEGIVSFSKLSGNRLKGGMRKFETDFAYKTGLGGHLGYGRDKPFELNVRSIKFSFCSLIHCIGQLRKRHTVGEAGADLRPNSDPETPCPWFANTH